MPEIGQNVTMALPAVVDDGVRLGYRSGRSGLDANLTIGPNAFLRTGTIIYADSVVGAGLNTGHNVIIREETIVGDNTSIWSNSVIDYGCRIGDNVKIHTNVYVAQFVVMMIVLETGGLSQIQIGRRFDLPAYATTRVLNALEERGLVERRASPTSRRAYSIYASDAGQKLAPDLFAIVQQVNADFMKPLPEKDHAEFRRMILQIMMG